MNFKIKNKWNGEIMFSLETTSIKLCLEAAVKGGADFRAANLYGADLCGADLHGADLCGADLCEAILRGADLCGANLYGANLCGANLYGANLCGADLRAADLCGADLCGADLDFSSGFSFKCTSFNIKLDLKSAAQMAYHFCRMDFDNDEAKEVQKALKNLANKFHRVDECGGIE